MAVRFCNCSSVCLFSHVLLFCVRYTFVIAAIVIAIAFEIDGLTDGPFHALCLLLSLATTNNIVLMYILPPPALCFCNNLNMYILSFFVDDPVMMQVH